MNYVLLSQKSHVEFFMPALSGCDTTSSFFGIGKKSVYKQLKDATPDFHDLENLGDPDKDVAILCSSRFVARLYDQKKSFASSHHNINKLRVKLATSRDANLVRLPPSEAAPRQHILRASFQTKVWHASCLVKPPLPPPMENGWRTVKDSLHPVCFEGNMSAEFFRDLVCSCKGKSQCKKSCVCSEQNLLHVLTYVLPKDQNHVKASIHISLQKTFNVLTT
jgi:hypothetical protein